MAVVGLCDAVVPGDDAAGVVTDDALLLTGIVGAADFDVPDVVVTVRDDGDVTGVHGGAATTDVG
ncbi:MAG: hypothetical protein BGO26_08050 [Actinobacteria bacterium 69-20]|jgi:hypothetical protein|nr:hypothetical protein [Actinomycetota bacterium]OJV30279.1 MAG: hypothetical protein BGO26_08050 [Actinobacteria bacterium 69-20]